MRFVDESARYVVDLEQPPERRWDGVIAAERDAAQDLLRAGWSGALRQAHAVKGIPLWLLEAAAGLARGPFHLAYRAARGRFLPEIYRWADALGAPRSQFVLLQCMYELSHLDPHRPPAGAPGCTAGVRWVEGLGLAHLRTLDWNLPAVGPATRLFEFRRGARTHWVVGLPGLVGALSGMVPGGYSVTINWAPPATLPFYFSGPLFDLRETLETCDTYAQAVERLTRVRLATSVFFTVCGVRPGEGCVIERVKERWLGGQLVRVRTLGDGVLAQSNHYQHPDLARFNGAVERGGSLLMRTSRARAAAMLDTLRAPERATDAAALLACLRSAPLCNEETHQMMVFLPARGELALRRETGGDS